MPSSPPSLFFSFFLAPTQRFSNSPFSKLFLLFKKQTKLLSFQLYFFRSYPDTLSFCAFFHYSASLYLPALCNHLNNRFVRGWVLQIRRLSRYCLQLLIDLWFEETASLLQIFPLSKNSLSLSVSSLFKWSIHSLFLFFWALPCFREKNFDVFSCSGEYYWLFHENRLNTRSYDSMLCMECSWNIINRE